MIGSSVSGTHTDVQKNESKPGAGRYFSPLVLYRGHKSQQGNIIKIDSVCGLGLWKEREQQELTKQRNCTDWLI